MGVPEVPSLTCFCFCTKGEAWSCAWGISTAWAERLAAGPLETSTWVSNWASLPVALEIALGMGMRRRRRRGEPGIL